MRTITVTLPDDLADEVERLAAERDWEAVKAPNADDIEGHVIRDGRLVPITHAELKASLHAAIAEADRDGWHDGETVMAEMMAGFDEPAK